MSRFVDLMVPESTAGLFKTDDNPEESEWAYEHCRSIVAVNLRGHLAALGSLRDEMWGFNDCDADIGLDDLNRWCKALDAILKDET